MDVFISLERRFIQRDWEPAQLDGGQFCEVPARILCHQDSGNLNPGKDHDECLTYIEDQKGQNTHAITPHRDALHLAKVLRTIYKFRSQRAAKDGLTCIRSSGGHPAAIRARGSRGNGNLIGRRTDDGADVDPV